MAVMREEISGPLLPVVPYETPAQAFAFVNERTCHPALYWFSAATARARNRCCARRSPAASRSTTCCCNSGRHGANGSGQGAPPVRRSARGSRRSCSRCPSAGPESTARLRTALDRQGFASFDWGYGIDTGPRTANMRNRLRRLEELVIDIFEAERSSVTLIGWGFSGIYARELAKRTAPLVRQVITLGTPFNAAAGPLRDAGPAAGRIGPAAGRPAATAARTPARAWHVHLHHERPRGARADVRAPESITSENILVPVPSHRELADHPQVREIIIDRLAQPPLQWRRFARR